MNEHFLLLLIESLDSREKFNRLEDFVIVLFDGFLLQVYFLLNNLTT